ncbi:hypothetical protein HFO56_02185 [Rhizobium laguerreae]|uniref:hypothetical protein n=1 Tax=Rhizobium laguerreae TaxID=1076926 RepID=UPI001C928942|nr:hypothetical protein [Rhizobium laguerreae]MBY3151214.1 hypothetical protein [Rhizobium laguerreae]
MRSVVVAMAFCALPSLAGAVDLTLQKIAPIAPVPVGGVTKLEMAPPPGIALTPAPARPAYEVIAARQAGSSSLNLPKSIPVPQFNPVSVSYCQSDHF